MLNLAESSCCCTFHEQCQRFPIPCLIVYFVPFLLLSRQVFVTHRPLQFGSGHPELHTAANGRQWTHTELSKYKGPRILSCGFLAWHFCASRSCRKHNTAFVAPTHDFFLPVDLLVKLTFLRRGSSRKLLILPVILLFLFCFDLIWNVLCSKEKTCGHGDH